MQSGPQNLDELRYAGRAHPSWFLDLVQPDIGGGRLDPDEFAAIDENPQATSLRVSGLDQATFERLIAGYGKQFEAIEFWKCPRLEDLTPLEDLPDIRMVSFYWNQRSTRLWNLQRTPKLTALRFEDFARLHQLADLADGTALKEVVFGDAIWRNATFETLDPITGLTELRSLNFYPKRIGDGRIQPLGGLSNLQELSIPTNLFTSEQLAWLRARLPDTVESKALNPLIRLEKPLTFDGRARDVLLVGKRKPYLNTEIDATRIQRHVNAFEKALAAFRDDPSLDPH